MCICFLSRIDIFGGMLDFNFLSAFRFLVCGASIAGSPDSSGTRIGLFSEVLPCALKLSFSSSRPASKLLWSLLLLSWFATDSKSPHACETLLFVALDLR